MKPVASSLFARQEPAAEADPGVRLCPACSSEGLIHGPYSAACCVDCNWRGVAGELLIERVKRAKKRKKKVDEVEA